jgi:hypothetical protein
LLKTHADFPNLNLPKREQLNPAVINATLFVNFKIIAGKKYAFSVYHIVFTEATAQSKQAIAKQREEKALAQQAE